MQVRSEAPEQRPRTNPFLTMRSLEFFLVQLITLAFFPMSLVMCWIVLGTETTRDLMAALIRDWIQTLCILLILGVTVMGALVWWVISWFA